MLPRASNQEQEINGYAIPARVKVIVKNWALQRDPRFWKDPERFEPKRFENQVLDFVDGDFRLLTFGVEEECAPVLRLLWLVWSWH